MVPTRPAAAQHVLVLRLQDVNGPCPLLAIANALLLRGDIDLPAGARSRGLVRLDDLLSVLAEYLLLGGRAATAEPSALAAPAAAGPLPKLRRIVQREVPNAGNRRALLLKGDIDGAWLPEPLAVATLMLKSLTIVVGL